MGLHVSFSTLSDSRQSVFDSESFRNKHIKMATKPVAGKVGVEEEPAPMSKIRITLTSRNVVNLEKVCAALVEGAKKKTLKVKGPVRMPTKVLRITTRKGPSGQGTNTFDKFEMRIHKRLIDLHCPADQIRDITNILIEPGVEVEVTIN